MKKQIIKPERFSGHKLVDYLIAHPQAQGKFKWHTLRSCMWMRLLSACPQYASYADNDTILRIDLKRILKAQWQLVTRIRTDKLLPCDWVELLVLHPELADHCDLDKMNGYNWTHILAKHPGLAARCRWEKIRMVNAWSSLLKVRPEFADRCPWETLSGGNWSGLLGKRPEFAEHCNWKLLKRWDWYNLIRDQPQFLSRFTMDHFAGMEHFSSLLDLCYKSHDPSPGGMFKNFSGDPASFMVFKTMDRPNARKFIRECFAKYKWEFLMQLHDLAPNELNIIARKKQTPFLVTLKAPDVLFRKYFRSVDPSLRDEAGNTLLHCALVHDSCSNQGGRYEFMLEHGCDPGVCNTAGFSCNDLIEWLKKHPVYNQKMR